MTQTEKTQTRKKEESWSQALFGWISKQFHSVADPVADGAKHKWHVFLNTRIAGLVSSFFNFLKSKTIDMFGSNKFTAFVTEAMESARNPVTLMLMQGDERDQKAALQTYGLSAPHPS